MCKASEVIKLPFKPGVLILWVNVHGDHRTVWHSLLYKMSAIGYIYILFQGLLSTCQLPKILLCFTSSLDMHFANVFCHEMIIVWLHRLNWEYSMTVNTLKSCHVCKDVWVEKFWVYCNLGSDQNNETKH